MRFALLLLLRFLIRHLFRPLQLAGIRSGPICSGEEKQACRNKWEELKKIFQAHVVLTSKSGFSSHRDTPSEAFWEEQKSSKDWKYISKLRNKVTNGFIPFALADLFEVRIYICACLRCRARDS